MKERESRKERDSGNLSEGERGSGSGSAVVQAARESVPSSPGKLLPRGLLPCVSPRQQPADLNPGGQLTESRRTKGKGHGALGGELKAWDKRRAD